MVLLPFLYKGVFHVEHPPIEKSAPATRSFLDQSMHLGVDDLHRKYCRQLRKGRNAVATHFCSHAERRSLDAQSGATLCACLAIDHKPVGTETNQVIQAAGAE